MPEAGTIPICTRAATIFTADGTLDIEGTRAHFERLASAGVGMWIGSGGSGEGFAMNFDELGQVYALGSEVSKGRVLVGSNQPETHTPATALEHARVAIDAGVDVVSLYGPSSWHGFRPTDREFLTYMDHVVGEIDHPVAISPNGSLGYAPAPHLLAAVAAKYPHVTTINLTGIDGDSYLLDLMDRLDRELVVYHGWPGSMNALAMGATGFHDAVAEGNILPLTFREHADALTAGDIPRATVAYENLKRYSAMVSPWKAAGPRWLKLAMRVYKLYGGDGGLREPYLMPSEEDQAKFLKLSIELDIPEVNDMLKAAGVS